MDPDETLRILREAVVTLDRDNDTTGAQRELAAAQIVDYFKALDEWLSTAGHLPKEWES